MSRGEVAISMRRRVEEALRPQGTAPDGDAAGSGSGGGGAGSADAGGARPWLGLHQVAQACAARAFGPDEPYEETAAGVARRVGLVALRDHSGRPPADRVAAAVASPESFVGGLPEWLRGLDRAGRAAVAATATAWVVDTLALAHRGGAEPAWERPGTRRFEPALPAPVLAATADATRVTADGRAHLFLTRPGSAPTDRRLAGHLALVWVLTAGQVPASVVIGHRDSLTRTSFPVDDAVLDAAVDEVTRLAQWALHPADAPVVPGPGCAFCHLRAGCGEGSAWAVAAERGPVPGGRSASNGQSVGSAVGDEPTM